MPELPDINTYLHALDSRIVGQVLRTVRIGSPFVLRTAQPPIAEAQGRVVRELRRIGKRVAIGLDNDGVERCLQCSHMRLHCRYEDSRCA
jgi:formamidopyrimidine-DNA glycosylase